MSLPIKKEHKDLEIYFDGKDELKFYEDISLDIAKAFEKLLGTKLFYLFISFGSPKNYGLYLEVGVSSTREYEDLYFDLNAEKNDFVGGFMTRGASMRGKFSDELLDKMIKKLLEYHETRQFCNHCGRFVSKNYYITNSGFCFCKQP